MFSLVRITELDFLLISSTNIQFPSLNLYFRGVPPTFPLNPSLMKFFDFQIVLFNLEFHSSSNIFSSLYSDLQTINSNGSSDVNSQSFYVNPITNQLISDFSIILDSFNLTSGDISISSSNFVDSLNISKQQQIITIKFSLLTVQIIYNLPDFRFIDIQLIPNDQVRSFDAKMEVYFKNINISTPVSSR